MVKDGQVVEIKEVEKEEVEMAEVTEEVTEEVAMEDTAVTEEEEVVEEVATEMAVEPATDAEAIKAIILPIIEEQVNAVIGMVADLKNQIEEMGIAKEEQDIEMAKETKMSSVFDKFKAFRASNK